VIDASDDHARPRRWTPAAAWRYPLTHDCVVAHAVQVEPVSIAEFPANREINRDIRQIGPREPISNPNTRAKLLTCGKIPYATEQAIILEEQGIRTQE